VFALGKFPGMKVDRPGAAIIGAVLMVAFRIVCAQPASSTGSPSARSSGSGRIISCRR
jgi:hypothetical protein